MAIQTRRRVGAHGHAPMQAAPQTRRLPALGREPRSSPARRFWQRLTARHEIWLDAFFVWGLTRILLLGLTALIPALRSGTSALKQPLALLRAWYAQDAAQYTYIAQHGYDQPARAAYFPLFPLVEHLLAPTFHGDYALAGMVVANLACFGALVILRDLVARDFGADTAHRTVLYLAIFPAALSFFAPASASLSLFLAVGAFAALRGRHWWLGGVLGGLAALTGVAALLLLIPFALEFLEARRYRMTQWWESLAAILIPAGTGIYALYLELRFRNPLLFLQAEGAATSGPRSLVASVVAGVAAAVGALRKGAAVGATFAPLAPALGAALVILVLAGLVAWQLPRSYGLYAAVLLVGYLLVPSTTAATALQGQARFVAEVFPVFILLAQWGAREKVHEALVLAQVTLLTVLVVAIVAASGVGTPPLPR